MSQGAWTTFCCPKGQERAPQSSIQTLSTPGRNFSGKADLLNPAIYFHHHFSNHKSADCRLRDRRSPQGTDERPALVRLLAESENDRRLAHRGSSDTRLSDRRKQRPRSRQSRFQRGPQKPVRNRRSAAPPGKPSATPLQTSWNSSSFRLDSAQSFSKLRKKSSNLTPRCSVPGGSSARQSRLD